MILRRHQNNHEDQERGVIPPFRVRRGRRPFVVAAVRRDSLPDRRRSSEHGRIGLGIAPAADDTGRSLLSAECGVRSAEGGVRSARRDAKLALREQDKRERAARRDAAPYRAGGACARTTRARDFERAFQGGAGLPSREGFKSAKRRGRSETAARGAKNPCLRVERSNTELQNPAGKRAAATPALQRGAPGNGRPSNRGLRLMILDGGRAPAAQNKKQNTKGSMGNEKDE